MTNSRSSKEFAVLLNESEGKITDKRNFIQRTVDFHYQLFLDERDNVSIKPFLAYVCTIYLCISLGFTVYNPNTKPADSIVNAIMMIAMACLGADSADKFSLKGKKADKNTDPDEERYIDPEQR